MMCECSKIPVPFCNCTDKECPNNPVNHAEGCTRCIAKCLALDEIPTCFFKAVEDTTGRKSWHYDDFARAVLKTKT